MISEEFDFFISYPRESFSEIVLPLAETLEKTGIKVWVDRDNVRLGCKIDYEFNLILDRSTKWIGSILILNINYCRKEWCKKELDYFLANSVNIFPLLDKISWEEVINFEPYLDNIDNCTISYDNLGNIANLGEIINKILIVYIDHIDQRLNDQKHLVIEPILELLISEYEKNKIHNKKLSIINAQNISNYLICQNNKQLYKSEYYSNPTKEIIQSSLPREIQIIVNIINERSDLFYFDSSKLQRSDFYLVNRSIELLKFFFNISNNHLKTISN